MSARMSARPEFKLVCINCDALGIIVDFLEDAPASTQLKCSNCKSPRGTLGDLRALAYSDERNPFGR